MDEAQQIAYVKETFDIYDTDKGGTLDPEEIRFMFDQMCKNKNIPKLPNSAIENLVKTYDSEGEGTLTPDDVQKMLDPIKIQDEVKVEPGKKNRKDSIGPDEYDSTAKDEHRNPNYIPNLSMKLNEKNKAKRKEYIMANFAEILLSACDSKYADDVKQKKEEAEGKQKKGELDLLLKASQLLSKKNMEFDSLLNNDVTPKSSLAP